MRRDQSLCECGRTVNENNFEFYDAGNDLESYVYQALGAASVCWESMDGTGVFNSDRALEIGKSLISKIRETHQDQGTLQYKIHRQRKMLTALEKAREVEVLDVGWYELTGITDTYPTRIRWADEIWVREKRLLEFENQGQKLSKAYSDLRSSQIKNAELRAENDKLKKLLQGRI